MFDGGDHGKGTETHRPRRARADRRRATPLSPGDPACGDETAEASPVDQSARTRVTPDRSTAEHVTARETASRDAGPRKTASRETASRETASRDAAAPDSATDRAALHAALDELLDGARCPRPADLPASALTACLDQWHRIRLAIEGAALTVLPAWEAAGDWAADGAASASQWSTGRFHGGTVDTRAWCRTARLSLSCPLTRTALQAGLLSPEHAHELVRARRAEIADQFDRDEAALVDAATTMQLDRFKAHLQAWRLGALEEAGENEPDRPPGPSEEADRLHLTRSFGQRLLVEGELGPEAGAELLGAIDAEIDTLRRTGQLAESGAMSAAELRAAALLAIVRRGAPCTTTAGAPRPSIIAIADLDTLLRRATDQTQDRLARRADILAGGPIATATLQRLLCDANLSLVITDADRRPLWVGRTRRTATAAQRTALLVRSGGTCEWPDCDAPPAHCRAHHLVEWNRGGPTDLPNLAWLCNHHHKAVHEQGFQLRHDGSQLHVRRRDGTPVGRAAEPPSVV